ncbi:hypothetical protein ALMP_59260 [Streptomyces sp. A012304]|nr:hypothetical protein ALMP_59260 [Streptomyces sp. A012304]
MNRTRPPEPGFPATVSHPGRPARQELWLTVTADGRFVDDSRGKRTVRAGTVAHRAVGQKVTRRTLPE